MATGKLTVYRAKRDFSKTSEPSGQAPVARSERRRFVIQKHAARRLHYDLRLELDGVFKSWAVTKGPSLDPGVKRLAVEVEDHPLDYGDFEGTIPPGEYGGGTVQLWDRGYWQPEGSRAAEEMLRKGRLRFELEGERLHGAWVLVRMRDDRNGGQRHNWLLIKHHDAFERPGNGDEALAEDRSVASGRTMEEIAAGKGRRPRPFMLRGAAYRADAVWNSNRSETREPALPVPPVRAAVPPVAMAAPAKRPPRGRRTMHLPQFIKPQLAALRERPPAGAGWVHEIDLAGYRLQLRVARGTCVLRTRKGRDWTRRFGSLARQLRALPDCIIDGEIMALDQQGAPDFAALQAALAEDRSDSLIFFAFDLLFLGQEDLRRLALSDRKGRLRELLAQHPQLGAAIRYVEHFTSAGDAVLQSACRMSLEGIVSKKLVAPYRSGRGQSWLESRCHTVHEVLIGGWRESAGRLRSLQVGVCQGTHLYHLASVTAGLKGASPRLRSRLTQHEAHRSPFAGRNAPQMARGIHWLEPPLAAEVELTGWSEDGLLRQAALKRLLTGEAASELRGAKPAADRAGVGSRQSAAPRARAVAQPRVAPSPSGPAVVMGVKLTKADKALWPATAGEAAITKLDLARYFEQVGAWMMEHMRGRPCSIIRAPDGIGGQRFFQRHATPGTSSLIELVKIAGDSKPYLQVDRIEGLAALAQVAAVELHPWNSAPGQPEVPGRFVFDLDPAPDVPFERVVEAAIELRQRLENLGLIAFCKTTGGKGLHLVTPFSISRSAAVGWPEAKALAREICVRMAADSPRKYLVTMAKSARTGRIFLDYLRNDRMATAVAPLSPRARSGAPVSMPLKWSQVRRGLNPQRYTVRTVPGLLGSSDAWHDYCECERPLREALKRVGGNMRRRDAQAAARGTPA